MGETPHIAAVIIQPAWLRIVPVHISYLSIIINSAPFHYQVCLKPINYMGILIIAAIKLFSTSSLLYQMVSCLGTEILFVHFTSLSSFIHSTERLPLLDTEDIILNKTKMVPALRKLTVQQERIIYWEE